MMARIDHDNIGDVFQALTKMVRPEAAGPPAPLEGMEAPEDAQWIELPDPEIKGGAPLWETLQRRRSVRDYTDEALTAQELSQLLWACQGVTAKMGPYALKTAPSAGARYPCDTYVVIHRSQDDIAPGVYRYLPEQHSLECLRRGDFARAIAEAALGQSMAADAPVVFAWTAVFERTLSRYRQRGYRYVYLDAAHIAANLALAAVGMGLASCQIAALFDDNVNRILGCDGTRESTLYMSVVGRQRS